MGYGQTCNVVTNSTFTGNANGWTLGGSGTGWYYEATWAPNEIYIEKDGAVDQSLKQSVTGLVNNSLTLSFKIKGQNANRLSTCPTTATLVIKLGGVTYMTINNAAGSVGSPNTQITTANITTSNGATYTQSGFPLTVGGATSGITITQGTITLTIPWNPATATTADLEFVATTSSTAIGSCLAWGGDDWFLDDIMLYTSNPVAYNMTGTSICEGNSTTIGVSNSQIGVNYQLYRNGSIAVGSALAGTGSPISFGIQTVTGIYTAVARAGTTGCTTPMNGSVSINPNPTLTNATQPAAQPAVCAGSAATINLTGLLPSTTSTINYTINGVAQTPITGVTSDASGTGSFTTPVLTIGNNGQILQITAITNTSATPNCTSSFARNVTLAVNATPTLTGASQPIATCVGFGATINLTGLLPNATSTINYSINGAAQTAVTGVVSDASGTASFSTVALTAANNGQQLRITGVATTNTTPNCSAAFTQNVTLSVNPAPTLTGASQAAAVCAGSGALINLTGLPVNSTSTINYTINSVAQAAVTGIVANGSGAASFTSSALTAANNGQQLRITEVTVTSSTPNCSATFTQNVTLAVNPVLTASVSISNSPAGTVCAGTNVTFTATPTNPGTTPVYQWKLNGVNVGNNSTTYSNSTLLLNNDVVTCEMTSNASPCLAGSPATSNAITVASAGPTTTGVTVCTSDSGSLSSSTNCDQTLSSSRSAGNGTSVTGVGTLAWSNPGRITADDNSNTSASRNSNGTTTTNYLQATNFGFTIPTNATITGVTVSVNRYASANSGSDYVRDNIVSLIKSGAVTSTNRGFTTTNWIVTTTNAASYGGTNDLWGSSWNPADINATNFGVALSATITRGSGSGTVTANVDYMQITVTYTVPGSIDWYTASSGGTLLGSGSSFNPVGVAGSGLANTNTPGTTIFYAACSSSPSCRTPTAFVINPRPSVTNTTLTQTICSGRSSTAVVLTSGITGTTFAWTASATAGVSGFTASGSGNIPVQTISTTGTTQGTVTYVITPTVNGCSGTATNYTILVDPTPATPTGSEFQTFCAAGSPTVANLTATGTGIKWYDALIGGNQLTAATPLISGNHYYASQTSGCESTTRLDVTVMLNATPVITPNKVDETCPSSNNGTISPSLSGGLTNIRYIKLTQKYADHQQVQEIQAFEIFTGNNVALASNGATASASSTYSNVATFGPQRAIDGDYAGYSFWHSASTNAGEYITVDLASAKNIDYLRIYNRSDCCQDRGQNMLLELFDASNNLVYAKTIDLWEGVNGAHYIDVNLLDVSWSDAATTLNRTGLDSGSYTLNYADAAGCSASMPINITSVNNVPTIASISAPSAFCPDGSLNPAAPTVTTNGSAISASGWQLETAVGSGSYSNLVVPYTVSFADNGKRIRYYATNGCGTTNSNSESIIVNQNPIAPTVGTIIHISCTTNTGSVELRDLPAGDWTINQTGDTAATYGNAVPNTTSRTISGLSAGSYTFTVTNSNGCTSAASTVTIFNNSNIWNGSSWSRGVPPNATMNVIIAAVIPNSPFTTNLVGCALTINSGVVATVPSGVTLTITNEVTVNGSLTFENNASLVQINNVNNNVGVITYRRNSQPMKNFDFTYWSSPVEGQTLYNLSPNTLWDKYQSYSGSGWKIETSTNVMQPGIGYIIRVPKPFAWPDPNAASYVQPVQFIGKPNNGHITSSQHMDKGKYYLIGNPYPSAIHADDFLFSNVNNRNILGGTIYFWTHNTAIKVVNSKLAYVSDDYASYNLTGGVATSAVSDPGYNDNPSLDTGRKPTGYIAAGQSFFTMAEDGSGYVEFNNSMRYGGTNNSQFFKPGKTSKSAAIEKHRLWLNLSNTGGAFKQTLIGYVDGATNGYDTNFDGMTYDGNSYIDFYSVNETSRLTIQGRALPFSDSDVVPLGYRSTIAGDFTIAIDQADGSLSSQRVYLEDKQTGTINELTAKNYTFTTKAGAFNNRFVLRYKNTTLGTGDFETVDDAVWVVAQNKTITVNSTTENIDKVFIYDVSGKELYSKDKVSNLEFVLQNQPFAQQVLLVKVVLENGYQTTKKVIFK
ncbi:T9SS sorting signal type C domain-containing protein [Flavobacterium gyeonganense]|nr:T9SS sorting signal type C domain-containing protein [Flavobacterium gyeonganense]